MDFQGSQDVKTTYNDLRTIITSDTSEAQSGTPKANVVKATGLGTLLGTTFGGEYDSNNRSLIDDSSSGITTGQNVFAIWNEGQFTGSVFSITAITKANPGVITTSTDHGHPSAFTADIEKNECEKLFSKALKGNLDDSEAELFRGQMLTEMAKMSLDDGLVMQLHPGSFRNHNSELFLKFNSDKGADIPQPTNYVHGLRPLLNRFGNEEKLTLILF